MLVFLLVSFFWSGFESKRILGERDGPPIIERSECRFPFDTEFKFRSLSREVLYDDDRRGTKFSGYLPCTRFEERELVCEQEICDTANGFERRITLGGDNEFCTTCVPVPCPAGFSTNTRTCDQGYEIEFSGFSNGRRCGRCVQIFGDCPEDTLQVSCKQRTCPMGFEFVRFPDENFRRSCCCCQENECGSGFQRVHVEVLERFIGERFLNYEFGGLSGNEHVCVKPLDNPLVCPKNGNTNYEKVDCDIEHGHELVFHGNGIEIHNSIPYEKVCAYCEVIPCLREGEPGGFVKRSLLTDGVPSWCWEEIEVNGWSDGEECVRTFPKPCPNSDTEFPWRPFADDNGNIHPDLVECQESDDWVVERSEDCSGKVYCARCSRREEFCPDDTTSGLSECQPGWRSETIFIVRGVECTVCVRDDECEIGVRLFELPVPTREFCEGNGRRITTVGLTPSGDECVICECTPCPQGTFTQSCPENRGNPLKRTRSRSCDEDCYRVCQDEECDTCNITNGCRTQWNQFEIDQCENLVGMMQLCGYAAGEECWRCSDPECPRPYYHINDQGSWPRRQNGGRANVIELERGWEWNDLGGGIRSMGKVCGIHIKRRCPQIDCVEHANMYCARRENCEFPEDDWELERCLEFISENCPILPERSFRFRIGEDDEGSTSVCSDNSEPNSLNPPAWSGFEECRVCGQPVPPVPFRCPEGSSLCNLDGSNSLNENNWKPFFSGGSRDKVCCQSCPNGQYSTQESLRNIENLLEESEMKQVLCGDYACIFQRDEYGNIGDNVVYKQNEPVSYSIGSPRERNVKNGYVPEKLVRCHKDTKSAFEIVNGWRNRNYYEMISRDFSTRELIKMTKSLFVGYMKKYELVGGEDCNSCIVKECPNVRVCRENSGAENSGDECEHVIYTTETICEIEKPGHTVDTEQPLGFRNFRRCNPKHDLDGDCVAVMSGDENCFVCTLNEIK